MAGDDVSVRNARTACGRPEGRMMACCAWRPLKSRIHSDSFGVLSCATSSRAIAPEPNRTSKRSRGPGSSCAKGAMHANLMHENRAIIDDMAAWEAWFARREHAWLPVYGLRRPYVPSNRLQFVRPPACLSSAVTPDVQAYRAQYSRVCVCVCVMPRSLCGMCLCMQSTCAAALSAMA